MKKILIGFGLVLLVVTLLPIRGFAIGPWMAGPHTAAWDPNTEADLAGYYVYYRPVGGTWDNARRSGLVAKSTTPRYDLLQLITANGNYEIMVTATNAGGDESGPSNIVPFVLNLPAAAKNARIVSTGQ